MNPSFLPRPRRAALAVLGLALAALPLRAATDNWNSAGTASWDTPGNWSAGSAPGSGDAVNVASGTIDMQGADRTVGGLAGSGGITNLSASPATLTIDLPENMGTFSGVIQDGTGAVALVKTGGGLQVLTGTNAYSGGTTVGGGTLAVSADANLGASSGGLTLDGGTLSVQSGFVMSRAVTLGNDGGVFAVANAAATLELDGAVGGMGGLTKAGAGTLKLTGVNAYMGGTTVFAGTLSVSADANLGDAAGGITLDGGTLEATAGFSSSRAITLNDAGGTIQVDAGQELILSDAIGGTASLTKTGAGTLTMDVSSTYSSTLIQAGTLKLETGGTLGSSFVALNPGSTLDLNGNGVEVLQLSGSGTITNSNAALATLVINQSAATSFYNGVIQDGAGPTAVIKEGAGSVFLTGTNTYTGGTTIRGGGLLALASDANLGATPGGLVMDNGGVTITSAGFATLRPVTLDAGGGTINVNSAAAVLELDGVVDGTGGLTKVGTGSLILAGTNTYAGPTAINAGTLEVDGATGVGAVAVNNHGTLQGAGRIGGGVTVASGGTLRAGTVAAPGTLRVAGDLTLQPGSATALRIYGANSYDRVAVAGTAALGGTLTLSYGGFVPQAGQSFTLVTADGGVTGQFASVVNPLQNALTFQTLSDPNAFGLGVPGVVVTPEQTSFVPFAASPNETSVARALDAAAGDSRAAPLIDYLNGLPGTSLAAALQRISPAQQTTVPPLVVQNAQGHFSTLNQRMGSIRAGSTGLALDQLNFNAGQIPLDSLMAGAGALPSGIKAFRPDPANRWGFFAAADGDVGEFTGGIGGQNSTFFGAGFDGGADYRLSPDLAVGFAAGYSKEKQDFDDAGSNVSVDTVRFGPYATWKDRFGDWLNASVGGAYHWFDSDRAGLGGSATSTTHGEEFDASAKYGRDFQVAKEWTLTPTLGFNYVHLDTDAYAESGSLAPLSVRSLTTQSLRSELGGTVAYAAKVGDVPVSPWVQAGWAHEFLDTTSAIDARLASGAGSVFTATGADSGSEIATFGAGLSASLTERLTASFAYTGQANEAYQDHSFRASLRWQF